ncbi:hypothetical protein GSH05_15330 [Burkholderia pseudomallei]|uniref:Uncharacterized protein n=1 Tax=Burkholderia pseudomallei (strain K96243) TaxID=272560 RepID=Q63W42_BURPS|nr:hypothetical protein AM256_05240 [Burkholderia pseudomallei]EIF70509.1 hypothetical protein BP354E_5207 [Burkholderia pseudomallei 354e]EIF80454.1 hypothetical protein BP354A_2326 [Burkholderia pseudomallei 354a]PNW95673.1 hypothetical protein CF649_30850 [Burkholderia sp. 136(2017)]PNX25763.1 hypothetical protein CF647_29325 [Burkholderia sp. 117]PNX32832.1 hypothetical protein CF648_30855 [Burkholderia sp. 137]CAH35043.1 hypothetical protein BPSL1047 [Burkholderia pseudomallei K96243]
MKAYAGRIAAVEVDGSGEMRACAVCWPVRFGDPWEAVGGRACDRSCIGERAEPGRCRGEPHAGRARVGASVPNPVRAAPAGPSRG